MKFHEQLIGSVASISINLYQPYDVKKRWTVSYPRSKVASPWERPVKCGWHSELGDVFFRFRTIYDSNKKQILKRILKEKNKKIKKTYKNL